MNGRKEWKEGRKEGRERTPFFTRWFFLSRRF
jgi:hypothetical protein